MPDKEMKPASTATVPDWLYAEPRFQVFKADHGNNARAAAQFGIELFHAGDVPRAAKALEAAVWLDPAQALYQGNYGVVLAALGQRDLAIEMFGKSLALDPDQFQIWLNLANTLVQSGRREDAEAAFNCAADHPDTAIEALTGLGLMRMRESHYAEAVDFFLKAQAAGDTSALLSGNLGAAYFQLGAVKEACAAYAEAMKQAPKEGFRENLAFLTMLDGVLDGKAERAVTHYAKPLSDDAILRSALARALLFLTSFGKVDAALSLVREWLDYYPEDIEPRYLKAVLEGRTLERAPKQYIAAHFDRIAERFDDRLLAALDYRVPEKTMELLGRTLGGGWRGDILDAGCGTGVMGVELKPHATGLTGVDLSTGMIAQAKARKIYDMLIVEDLCEFMASRQEAFDLVVAANSLTYSGALEHVFQAAATALKPRGWLAFDIESQAGTGYRVMPTGRFRHAEEYVRSAAKGLFRVADSTAATLRREAGKPVEGFIFLMRKI